jgi:hypothetical protein
MDDVDERCFAGQEIAETPHVAAVLVRAHLPGDEDDAQRAFCESPRAGRGSLGDFIRATRPGEQDRPGRLCAAAEEFDHPRKACGRRLPAIARSEDRRTHCLVIVGRRNDGLRRRIEFARLHAPCGRAGGLRCFLVLLWDRVGGVGAVEGTCGGFRGCPGRRGLRHVGDATKGILGDVARAFWDRRVALPAGACLGHDTSLKDRSRLDLG